MYQMFCISLQPLSSCCESYELDTSSGQHLSSQQRYLHSRPIATKEHQRIKTNEPQFDDFFAYNNSEKRQSETAQSRGINNLNQEPPLVLDSYPTMQAMQFYRARQSRVRENKFSLPLSMSAQEGGGAAESENGITVQHLLPAKSGHCSFIRNSNLSAYQILPQMANEDYHNNGYCKGSTQCNTELKQNCNSPKATPVPESTNALSRLMNSSKKKSAISFLKTGMNCSANANKGNGCCNNIIGGGQGFSNIKYSPPVIEYLDAGAGEGTSAAGYTSKHDVLSEGENGQGLHVELQDKVGELPVPESLFRLRLWNEKKQPTSNEVSSMSVVQFRAFNTRSLEDGSESGTGERRESQQSKNNPTSQYLVSDERDLLRPSQDGDDDEEMPIPTLELDEAVADFERRNTGQSLQNQKSRLSFKELGQLDLIKASSTIIEASPKKPSCCSIKPYQRTPMKSSSRDLKLVKLDSIGQGAPSVSEFKPDDPSPMSPEKGSLTTKTSKLKKGKTTSSKKNNHSNQLQYPVISSFGRTAKFQNKLHTLRKEGLNERKSSKVQSSHFTTDSVSSKGGDDFSRRSNSRTSVLSPKSNQKSEVRNVSKNHLKGPSSHQSAVINTSKLRNLMS